MKVLFTLCACVAVLHYPLYAQSSFDNYQPMMSVGEVPADFNVSYAERKDDAFDRIDFSDKNNARLQKKFEKQNQYFIDRTLNSGNVLFGDDVTLYVQKVLDHVLELYGDTKKDIRAYTVRTPVFNAAATQDGILFVNLGLMAQVENEAQLAFILAHEIIHSEEDHVFEGFKEKTKSEKDNFLSKNEDTKLLELSIYSKRLEFEADLEAFKRVFAKSGYDYREVLRSMDVMLYSYLPFEEIPFPSDFFNSGSLVIDPSIFPTSVNPITAIEDFNDSLASHPNLRLRKAALKEAFKDLTTPPTNKLFLVDEQGFFHARNTARFELCRIQLSRRQYADAIYNAFVLLEDFPNNAYLRQIIGEALYGMAMYKNLDHTPFLPKTSDVEGNKMSLVYFLQNSSAKDLNIIATRYNYELHQAFPNNTELATLFELSLKELVYFHEINEDFFAASMPNTEEEEPTAEENEESQRRRGRGTKVSNLKQQAGQKLDFAKYAFVDLLAEDTAFKRALEGQISNLKKDLAADGSNTLKERRVLKEPQRKSISNKKEKRISRENEAKRIPENSPVESLIVLPPSAFSYNNIKVINFETGTYFYSPDFQLKQTTKQQALAQEILEMALETSGMPHNWIDLKQMQTADAFNDYINITSYLSEFYAHPTLDNRVVESQYVKQVIEKYNTPYVLLTFVKEELGFGIGSSSVPFTSVLLSLAFPYFAPGLVASGFQIKTIEHTLVIVNIETGKFRTIRVDEGLKNNKFERANLIHSHLVDLQKVNSSYGTNK